MTRPAEANQPDALRSPEASTDSFELSRLQQLDILRGILPTLATTFHGEWRSNGPIEGADSLRGFAVRLARNLGEDIAMPPWVRVHYGLNELLSVAELETVIGTPGELDDVASKARYLLDKKTEQST